jgi:hypothetical protein
MKYRIIILLLFICILNLIRCKNEVKPALSVSFSESPDTIYNCNTQSRFQVSLRPYNAPGMVGDYRKMFFRLQVGDTNCYESNDIDFPMSVDGSDTVYTLEIGGNIEGEFLRPSYSVIGYLKLFDNGSIIETTSTQGGYVSVIPKTSFSKTMHIEYDAQQSHHLTPGTFVRVASAFHVADTDTDFLRDEMYMRDSSIAFADLGRYHLDHWSNTSGYNMHLLAIRGLADNTDSSTGGSPLGGPYGFSFVYVYDIMTFNPNDYFYVLYKTTVHELGHQRGGLRHASGDDPHPYDHNSPFCAMNQGINYSGDNDNDPYNDPPGLIRWFITNPHFCPNCINTLKNISW